MTISIISATPRSSGTAPLTWTITPRANSKLVLIGCIGVEIGTQALGSVSDSITGVWKRERYQGGGNGFGPVEAWAHTVTAATARTITYSGGAARTAVLYELSGSDAPPWNNTIGVGSSNVNDSITTTEEDSLVFAATSMHASGGTAPTALAGLTQDTNAYINPGTGGDQYGHCIGHAFVPTPSTFQAKFTISASSVSFISTCTWEVVKAKTPDGAYWGQRA